MDCYDSKQSCSKCLVWSNNQINSSLFSVFPSDVHLGFSMFRVLFWKSNTECPGSTIFDPPVTKGNFILNELPVSQDVTDCE